MRHVIVGLAVAAAMIATAVIAGSAETGRVAPASACPLVILVEFDDPAELGPLATRLEPWEVRREEGIAVFGVSPAELVRLEDAGFQVVVDFARTRAVCDAITRRPKIAVNGIPGFACYRTRDETYGVAAALASDHPDLVELRDIGDSWEKLAGRGGADLQLLRITNRTAAGVGSPDGSSGKPVLYAQASMHAREYTPAETLTRFAERLVAGYGDDPDITWILDQHEVHLLLMANPDGRTRAEQGTLWRKNADDEFCTGSERRGVDLNRNFEHDWSCCNGSSGQQCSEIYRGPAPASEPETVAIESYLRTIFDDRWAPVPAAGTPGLFLDLHSSGRLVLWPWGATHDVPPNGAALASLGARLAAFSGSTPIQGIDFYPVDGAAMDFAYADRGIAAFTIEIGYQFFEPCAVYEAALVDDMLATLMYAARVAGAPYRWPAGPDIGTLGLTPAVAVYAGDLVELGGRAARRVVAEVEATVDVPPWAADATARLAANAVDGTFDSADEEFSVAVPTAGLSGGRHLVYARARGADGSWGPAWAVFLDIVDVTPRRPARRLGD